MEVSSRLAEIAGAFAADGCLQQLYVCFWGHITEDAKYYKDYFVPLFEGVFVTKVNDHEKKSNSVYGFYACDKHIISVFTDVLGFTPGNKTYSVRMPEPIRKSGNPDILAAFIRGFADCDGCLNFMKRGKGYSRFSRTRHAHPRIQLSSVSEALIKDVSSALDLLSIQHATWKYDPKPENFSTVWRIQVAGRKNVADWMQKVGFSNPAKLTRYNIFKEYGFCPPRTTMEVRKNILRGKCDPESFYEPVA